MKVTIVKDACIGCGACQAISPKIFELNDEGIAEVKIKQVPKEDKEDVIDAMESCPTGAIEIDDED